MLRIDRTLQTLKAWLYQPAGSVKQMKVQVGDYANPSDAVNAHGWETVDLPWYKQTHDERFFLEFEVEVPPYDEDLETFVEISTGREGEWDAVNPQLLVYVENRVICGLDVNHRTILMARDWHQKNIKIHLHLYTGMSPGDLRFRIELKRRSKWLNKAYHDLRVGFETLKCLQENSPEAMYIKKVLSEGVYNLRLGTPQCQATKKSCEELSNYLGQHLYGKTSLMENYTVHAVGHTHIDVAWLWDLKQTEEKVVRSYSTALHLQDRYPGYKFMASQPALYEMLMKSKPEVFKKVVESTQRGDWESEGAMYLEADCNLIAGESMIRQIELGQAYFQEHFGKPSRTLWLPDVFGYSAALPQILKGFGIELFVTSKISWNENNKLPFDSFRWRGLDGTEIPTQFITTMSMETLKKGEFKTIYEGNFTATEVLGAVYRHQQKDLQPHTIMPYGFGDGGGGATEEMLETAARLVKGIPGMPRVKMSHVSDFIKAFGETALDKLPVWVGELYLEYHRGTYTTNGLIKQMHRTLENNLLAAEKLDVIAGAQGLIKEKPLVEPWRLLLLNQFHDILPGTSVKRVYDEAYEQLERGLDGVAEHVNTLFSEISQPSDNGVMIFNPHGHSFTGILNVNNQLLEHFKGTHDGVAPTHLHVDGVDYPLQNGQVYVNALPPMSLKPGLLVTLPIGQSDSNPSDSSQPDSYPSDSGKLDNGQSNSKDSPFNFTTPHYNVKINEQGQLVSLFDLESKRELILPGGTGNRLSCYEDRPQRWDAWDINEDYKQFELAFDDTVAVTLLEDGPVVRLIKVASKIGESTLEQTLGFYKDSKRIDFKTKVDWHEQQTLLRVAFDLNLHATEAKYDIQFGHVKRPIDQNHSYNASMFEVCGAHWGDLSEDDFGVALISNDKFGYSALGSTLGMSLIKSPTYPNVASDQGLHEFEYALYPHRGDAIRGGVHQEAMGYSQRPRMVLGSLKTTEFEKPWIENLPENLQLESLRWLDDGRAEVRLVEHFNRRGTATLCIPKATSLEQVRLSGEKMGSLDGTFQLDYKPFEIITLRCHLQNK